MGFLDRGNEKLSYKTVLWNVSLTFRSYIINNWLNYKLHPLSFVKVQINPLSFDRFNLVF